MDPLYVHIALNHAPVFGLMGCVLLLLWALITRSRDVARAALAGTILVALIAIPVYLTGEPSEERVEDLPGVSHDAIEEHEDAAKYAFWVVEATGAIALIGLVLARKRPEIPRAALIATLLVALIGSVALARTANLGGKIRHTELSGP
jgi:hypothetical protein